MKKKAGILRFPGTNCDRDVWAATLMHGMEPAWLWHADRFDASAFDALYLPGGFSYGDYLRAGALAARAPAMHSVKEAADRGVPILGVCNGFQILCEAGLLPGALVRNRGLRFIDDWVGLELVSPNPHFAPALMAGSKARLSIEHADGQFYVEDDELKRLEDQGQIWWRYETNPNGSRADIAGVMNRAKNVAALMPHPERALEHWMGSIDGRVFFS